MARQVGHAFVVGGTGMLRGVVLELARRWSAVTVVARTRRRLESLESLAAGEGGRVHGIATDWREPGALGRAARDAMARDGAIELAVVWAHANAGDGPLDVARAIAGGGPPCRFVHVLGSAHADPSRPDDGRVARFGSLPGVRYEEVVLGFVPEAGGSRWLTQDEIAAGVLRAIDAPAARTVVGVVAPWSARP